MPKAASATNATTSEVSPFLEERVNPMRIVDTQTGTTYTLDFNRASVKFAESRGFKLSETGDFPVTMMQELFFCAFRMHHPMIARNQTDKILDDYQGLTADQWSRLTQLYIQAGYSNLFKLDEDEETPKNGRYVVEMD